VSAITALRRRAIHGIIEQRVRLVQLVKFGLVGLSGIAVNTAALAIVTGIGGHHYVLGTVVATQASTTYNFAMTNRFVFREDGDHRFGMVARYLQFSAVNNSMLLLRVPIIVVLTTMGLHYLVSNIVSLVALFLVRFVVADRVIWRRAPSSRANLLPAGGPAVDG